MKSIKLPNGTWYYDPAQQLGIKGGFGIVYAGFSSEFGDLAIKRISVDPRNVAHRELRIADELKGKDFEHVIQFFDAGLDDETGSNYIVMVRAEKSLQQELNAGRTFTESETVELMLQVTKGLLEVPELVHRDLKPGNVLFHQGKWKVADFGIAKFVEESTSLQTLNYFLTPQYAAPEQWEYQRPTHAVDVYALGCIGYALLTGQPPFSGTDEDIKQQHLHSEPPTLQSVSPRLRLLLSMMLRKIPETRPSLERVKNLLEQLQESNGQVLPAWFSALSGVAASVADQSAKEKARKRTEQDEQHHRDEVAHEAMKILAMIIDHLFEKIATFAPNAHISPAHTKEKDPSAYPDRTVKLGTAKMTVNFSRFAKVPKDAFSQSKWNVYAGAIIKVEQETNRPYIWGANLWYTDLGKNVDFRWWEVTYMTQPLILNHQKFEPYAVDDLSLADQAASPIIGNIQLGANPKLVDDEAIEDFCDRWANILAKAATGELRYPLRLPLD